MEKIVRTTYHVPVLEYVNYGWQGTAEMDNSEFESFDKAALFELLCKEILRIVIDDYIAGCSLSNSEWERIQYKFEDFFKNDVIMSELFTSFDVKDFEYDDVDDIRSFTIILQKTKDIKSDNIYLTFEY